MTLMIERERRFLVARVPEPLPQPQVIVQGYSPPVRPRCGCVASTVASC